MNRKINQAGFDLIRYYEGLKLKAYRDPKGILTIGYGHTGQDVFENQEITSLMADLLLQHDIETAEKGVQRLVKPVITDNQFSACVSLAYNIGIGQFEKSTLLKEVNNCSFDKAAAEFTRWNKAAGKVLNGLTARRRAERDLFLKDT